MAIVLFFGLSFTLPTSGRIIIIIHDFVDYKGSGLRGHFIFKQMLKGRCRVLASDIIETCSRLLREFCIFSGLMTAMEL